LTTKWGLTPPELPQSLAAPFRHDDLTVATLCGSSDSRQGFEVELDGRGAALPLTSRVAWERHHRPTVSWFVTVRDEAGEACGGIAIHGGWSRAIPTHLVLRAERVGAGVPLNVLRAELAGLARIAREVPRVLRAHVELFSTDTTVRKLGGRILAEEGFRPVTRHRVYTRSLAVDLDGTEEEIFRRLHATARRHVRAAKKRDVRVATVSDLSYVERMRRLIRETFSRTGGEGGGFDPEAAILLSNEAPHVSRIVGLFDNRLRPEDALLAFAWGHNHGENAQYEAAASTRNTDLRMPLSYVLIWDLIVWAHRRHVQWFDLGGATEAEEGDPMRGIMDFKRYFARNEVEVGEEWVLEPRPRLGAIAAGIGWLRRIVPNPRVER